MSQSISGSCNTTTTTTTTTRAAELLFSFPERRPTGGDCITKSIHQCTHHHHLSTHHLSRLLLVFFFFFFILKKERRRRCRRLFPPAVKKTRVVLSPFLYIFSPFSLLLLFLFWVEGGGIISHLSRLYIHTQIDRCVHCTVQTFVPLAVCFSLQAFADWIKYGTFSLYTFR